MSEERTTSYCPECERLTAALRALDSELTKTKEREKRYEETLRRVRYGLAQQWDGYKLDLLIFEALYPEEDGK